MTTNAKHIPPTMDNARKVLIYQNRYQDITWHRLSEIYAVPVGTLHRFAHGGKIPPKWKANLGLKVYPDLFAMPPDTLLWKLENRE
jgi:hypothetical protein